MFVDNYESSSRIWVTRDEGETYKAFEIDFSIYKIEFHPTESEWLLGYDTNQKTVSLFLIVLLWFCTVATLPPPSLMLNLVKLIVIRCHPVCSSDPTLQWVPEPLGSFESNRIESYS